MLPAGRSTEGNRIVLDANGGRRTAPPTTDDPQTRRRSLIAGLSVVVLALGLLTWSKYLPYAGNVPDVLGSSDPGASILTADGTDGAAPGPSLAAGWHFTVAYLAGVWKALLAGLVIAAGVQVLLPSGWLRCAVGSRGGVAGGVRGSLLGTLTLMCSCCAAPVAVALRKARSGMPAAVGFWLGNPALNPVVLILLLAVLPWQWAALRFVGGATVVAIGIALARSQERRAFRDGKEMGAGAPSAPYSVRPSAAEFLRTLGGLTVRLLPEFLAVVFVLGTFRSALFPLGGTSGGTVVLVLALVIAGLLLPIPTGGEIAVVAGILAAGLPAPAAGALLVTLPVLSLPSLLMVRGAFPRRVLMGAAVTTAAVGLLAAVIAPVIV
jgi:uncharacterized membrane protein YraQ (UPF0718 family)